MNVIRVLCYFLLFGACTIPDMAFPPAGSVPPAPAPSESQVGPTRHSAAVLLTRRNDKERRYELHVLDLETGQARSEFPPIPVGRDSGFDFQTLFSGDGRRLAVVESQGETCEAHGGGAACRGRADTLHLVDLQAWQEVTMTLPAGGWVGPAAFSADGSRLAMVHTVGTTTSLMIVAPETGADLMRRPLPFRASQLFFSQAGSRLALFGASPGPEPGVSPPQPLQLAVLDAVTLEPIWQLGFPDILSGDWCTQHCDAAIDTRRSEAWTPAVVPSLDGDRLFIVHADRDRLTTVDLVNRAVRSQAIQKPVSWMERLLALTAHLAQAKGNESGAYKVAVLSPDETKLYVIGRTSHSEQNAQGVMEHIDRSLGLQVVDPSTGSLLDEQPVDVSWIRMAGDGAHLLLDGWDESGTWTDIWSVDDLKPVAHLPQWDVTVGRRLDGQLAYLAVRRGQARSELARLDPTSFQIVHTWPADTYAWWVLAP